jgi:hypothetical protein
VSSKPELLRIFPRARQLKYGSNAFISLVLLFAVLGFANYLTTRYKHRFDLTKSGSNTLSPQTVKILREKVKSPLHITYYYASGRGGTVPPAVQRLLRNYQGNSRNVHINFVDAIKELQDARRDGVYSVPTTVIKYPKVPNAVDRLTAAPDEQTVTGSILKLTSARKKRIFFMQGHGERDLNAFDDDSFSSAKSALEKLNFKVETLPLLQKGMRVSKDISADGKSDDPHDHDPKQQKPPSHEVQGVDVMVIAGPKTDLSPDEDNIVRSYLNKGGKMLLMLDPPETNMHQPVPRFQKLVSEYSADVLPGMLATETVIGFLVEFGLNPGSPSSHFILRGIPGACGFSGVLPMRRRTATPPGQTYTPLFQTSPQMLALDPRDAQVKLTGREPRGPFDAAFAVEESSVEQTKRPRWRVVVAGDSDWASNRSLLRGGNPGFLTSALSWLSEDESIIDIPIKPPITNSFGSGGGQADVNLLRTVLVVVVAVPLAVLIFGTVVWWQRR